MECISPSNAAFRRYKKRFIPLTLFYVATIILANALVPNDAEANIFTVSLALLPGLGVMGWIWAMGRLLIELDDEYLRMLEVRKFLVATGFALSIASVWGLLELYTEVPKLPVFMTFPIWCFGLGMGQVWNRISGA